jgi:hypothetical protein
VVAFGLPLVLLLALWVEAHSAEPASHLGQPVLVSPPPRWLSQTGLYPPGGAQAPRPDHWLYVPQYPLWSDGAQKRRFIHLPRGTSIDATDPDDFGFPVGTVFYKQFAFGRFGRPVETRTMELLPDGSWRFATYVWKRDGSDAELAPDTGVARAHEIRPGVFHDVPSLSDCRACHAGRKNPVLGFGTLQLSPERDPLAPHAEPVPPAAVDLAELVRRGALRNLPQALIDSAPKLQGNTPVERALRGYLFANCSSCHNTEGPLGMLGLDFDVSVSRPTYNSLRDTAVSKLSHFQPWGGDQALRIAPGLVDASVLAHRLGSREPSQQMPPLGTRLVDSEALALLRQFITEDLGGPQNRKDNP